MPRKPKPTHLKLVEGGRDRRAAKLKNSEPVPAGALDPKKPPEGFCATRKAIWAYAVENAPLGLLRRLDAHIFEAWCDAVYLRAEAMKKLQSGAMIIKTPKGMAVQNPYIGIVNRQAVIMKALAAELGFTPAARTRISLDPEGGEDDPAERYFR